MYIYEEDKFEGKSPQERLEMKMDYVLAKKYNECLLISDCIPDLIEYLKMVRDNNYTVDRDNNYSKMLGFILQELELIEIWSSYLSDNDKITSEGLEMLTEGNEEKYKDKIEVIYKE